MSNFLSTQGRFENARWVPSYHAESTHPIKLDHGTSSQPINHIPAFPSQTYGGHESSDAYANNASNNAQREQFPPIHSPEGLQLPPSSQTSPLSPSSPISQLPSLRTPKDSRPQPSYLDGTSGHTEESPLYVNAKQFRRILKRRVAIYARIRKPYIHESRHRHATRRPRGPGGKILTKDELKRKGKKAQNGTTDKSQRSKTGAGPNTSHAKKESVDWVAAIPTKDGKGERREEVRNRSRDKETGEPHAKQTSNVRSEHQIETKRSIKISKAMATSFYGATELEDLHQRFPTRTAADIRS